MSAEFNLRLPNVSNVTSLGDDLVQRVIIVFRTCHVFMATMFLQTSFLGIFLFC